MPGHDIIVIGASAGGVEALRSLVAGLPGDLPASIFVVLHMPPNGTSMLPRILERSGPLPARHATNGAAIERGRIYVAPPDHHLLVRQGHVEVTRGPRENNHRPAVDPLFRSAAVAYGPRVVGVVLSGALDDGTVGLRVIKRRGGIAIAQDPDEALFPSMPTSAIQHVQVDAILPVAAIAAELMQLAHEPITGKGAMPMADEADFAVRMAEFDMGAIEDADRPGTPSPFSCPECGGVLWELRDGELLRYRCRVGHAFTAKSLLADQSEQLEAALWAALRGLEEKSALAQRLAERARAHGHDYAAERFDENARDARRHADAVRRVLLTGKDDAVPEVESAHTGDG